MTEEQKNETITIKKDSLWKYSTFILGALVIIGAFVVFSGNNGSPTTGNVANTGDTPGQQLPAQGAKSQISADDDAVLGDKNAPVTIIEFSDYECPFCARFHSQTLPQLKKEYIDTGKAKLVYRDYPLAQIHRQATIAAEAAECVRDEAGNDEAYFEYHDTIFENQQSVNEANLKLWAQQQGFDINKCLDSGKFKSEVQKDLQDGGQLGTPTFFINGKQLRGAQPFSAFKQIIDAELA
jgi:protein-disulfide isomerase